MKLDHSQSAFVESPDPNHRLLAPAGSGKTRSLLWRANNLVMGARRAGSPRRVAIFAFTRAARDELRRRLLEEEHFSGCREHIRIDTLNAWGFRYLKTVQSRIAVKTTQPDRYGLVNNILRPIWKSNDALATIVESMPTPRYPDVISLFDDVKEAGFRHAAQPLMDHVAAQMRWLDSEGLGRYLESVLLQRIRDLGFAATDSGADPAQYELFFSFWSESTKLLWDSAFVTFADQKYQALQHLHDRYGEDGARSSLPEPNRYHHIMVDEFQDISPLDLALISALVSINRSTLTIVGDDDQAIYEWRGATPEFILNPGKYLNLDFTDHVLERNYRCPRNIVEHSQALIRHNIHRVQKPVEAVTSDDAEIDVRPVASHNHGLDFVLELAREANATGKPSSLAIIGRKKSQLLPIEILLTSNEIPFYAKEDLNVLLGKAFFELRTILEIIAARAQRRLGGEIASAIVTCCNNVASYPLRKAEQQQLYATIRRQNPRTIDDGIAALQEYTGSLRGKRDEETRYHYATSIARVLDCSEVSQAVDLIGHHFQGLQKNYARSEDDIFFKDPPFLYLAQYAERYGDDFVGFIDHVEQAISMMTDDGANADGGDESVDGDLNRPVHVMTALRAKGKEFDNVVLLDVNDGIWPSRFAEHERELEQERRLFYVAVTRARRRLILLPVSSFLGVHATISPYVREMGLEALALDGKRSRC